MKLELVLLSMTFFFIHTNSQAFEHKEQKSDESCFVTSSGPKYSVSSKVVMSRMSNTEKYTGQHIEYASPSVAADGKIITGSGDEILILNPDGTKKATFKTNGTVKKAAFLKDGTIVVPSEDGKVYFLNPDGTKKAEFYRGNSGYITKPAIMKDDTVVVGNLFGKIYFINPDGTKKAVFSTGGQERSVPVIMNDETVVVGSSFRDGESLRASVHFINPDGTKKSNFQLTDSDSLVEATPVIAKDGRAVVGDYNGKVYFFNSDGTKKAEFDTIEFDENKFHNSDAFSSSPAIMEDGTIVIASRTGKVYFLNPDGTKKNQVNLDLNKNVSYNFKINFMKDGTIVLADGDIYFLNPDGTKKTEFYPEGAITDFAIMEDDTIVASSREHEKYLGKGKSETGVHKLYFLKLASEPEKKGELIPAGVACKSVDKTSKASISDGNRVTKPRDDTSGAPAQKPNAVPGNGINK